MTKNELLEAIKAGTNEAEFETLGLTNRSDKSLLQGIFEQINSLRQDPVKNSLTGQDRSTKNINGQ